MTIFLSKSGPRFFHYLDHKMTHCNIEKRGREESRRGSLGKVTAQQQQQQKHCFFLGPYPPEHLVYSQGQVVFCVRLGLCGSGIKRGGLMYGIGPIFLVE